MTRRAILDRHGPAATRSASAGRKHATSEVEA
jgi:hypothetical protein